MSKKINKSVKIIKGILIVLLICSIGFFSANIAIGWNYLTGKETHYKGESILTPYQAAYFASHYSIGLDGYFYWFQIQEDGNFKATYDFYTDIDYYYHLQRENYSFWDAPLINSIKSFSDPWYIPLLALFIGCLMFGGMTLIIFKSYLIYDFAWKLVHPKYFFKKDSFKGVRPQITDSIKIDDHLSGILGARTWNCDLDGQLFSLRSHFKWSSKKFFANKIPSEKNENGVYAFRLGAKDRFSDATSIIGLVELKGEWNEHADGILRAEVCEILCLIASERYRKIANILSSRYVVPVIINKKPVNFYHQWILSHEGISYLKHNAEILKENIYGN